MTTPPKPIVARQIGAPLVGPALVAAALVLLILAAPGAARADSATSLLYERTLMDRAGARCHLFTPEIASALAAAGAQAREQRCAAGSATRRFGKSRRGPS